MSIVAGVDIGNSTTEVAIAGVGEGDSPEFLSSGSGKTTGIKGTAENISGIVDVLEKATEAAGIGMDDLDLVLLNEATPVIGDVAMETVTETVVTESSMVGHNPGSPGGEGIGVGQTTHIRDLEDSDSDGALPDGPVIVIVPEDYDFERAADILTRALEAGVEIKAGIVQGG